MKNLIVKISFTFYVLVLTSTTCAAQFEYSIYGCNKVIIVAGDTIEFPCDETITAKLLLAYEKECYNDSTYVEYLIINEPPSYTDSITGMTTTLSVLISPTLIKEWQHREPTFKGFLAWIREKYDL